MPVVIKSRWDSGKVVFEYTGGDSLQGAHLLRADLRGADLRGADLRGADLRGADLRRANLSGVHLGGANLSGAYLSRVHLGGAILSWANLSWANLSGADLSGADLSEADLIGVDLRGANLSEAGLRRADLRFCRGNMQEIKSLHLDTWDISYTHDILNIGCESHPIERWWDFTEAQISRMDERAVEWWRTWKPILQSILATSPAVKPQVKEEEASTTEGQHL